MIWSTATQGKAVEKCREHTTCEPASWQPFHIKLKDDEDVVCQKWPNMSPQHHLLTRLRFDVLALTFPMHQHTFLALRSHCATEGMGVVFLCPRYSRYSRYSRVPGTLLDMPMQQNCHETFERRRTTAT